MVNGKSGGSSTVDSEWAWRGLRDKGYDRWAVFWGRGEGVDWEGDPWWVPWDHTRRGYIGA